MKIANQTDTKIDVGTILRKGHSTKEYMVVGHDILCAGNVREFSLIRVGGWPPFKFIKKVYDENIRVFNIVKY